MQFLIIWLIFDPGAPRRRKPVNFSQRITILQSPYPLIFWKGESVILQYHIIRNNCSTAFTATLWPADLSLWQYDKSRLLCRHPRHLCRMIYIAYDIKLFWNINFVWNPDWKKINDIYDATSSNFHIIPLYFFDIISINYLLNLLFANMAQIVQLFLGGQSALSECSALEISRFMVCSPFHERMNRRAEAPVTERSRQWDIGSLRTSDQTEIEMIWTNLASWLLKTTSIIGRW